MARDSFQPTLKKLKKIKKNRLGGMARILFAVSKESFSLLECIGFA